MAIGGTHHIDVTRVQVDPTKRDGNVRVDAHNAQSGDYKNEVNIAGKKLFLTDEGLKVLNQAVNKQVHNAGGTPIEIKSGDTVEPKDIKVAQDPTGLVGFLWDDLGGVFRSADDQEKATSGKLK